MMRINWFSYYAQHDGYGRFASRMLQAIQRAGVDARGLHIGVLDMPDWLLEQQEIDWDRLTITCTPPNMLKRVPGKCWLLSMTEGSILPDGWADTINESGVERVIVPCLHNAEVFRSSGVEAPISVVPGGTDPAEFPLRTEPRQPDTPYTFLTFADRNERKGWHEVWDAFYKAFGGKTSGVQDVRLIIKYLPSDNVADSMASAEGADKRIIYQSEKVDDIAAVYAQADCLVLPSRCEGWGMIHREAAMSGLPVITQAHSGLDDGYTHRWAIVVEKGEMKTIPKERNTTLGEWRIADVDEIALFMRLCYDDPSWAMWHGKKAAQWLRRNQTWDHSAKALIDLTDSFSVHWPEPMYITEGVTDAIRAG